MTPAALRLAAAALLVGCATASVPAAVPCDRAALDAHVGKTVTLIGPQTRTKQPTVCGADVEGDYELSDKVVRVTGVLARTVVDNVDEREQVATRGPGVYYSVEDPKTKRLARPIAEPSSRP